MTGSVGGMGLAGEYELDRELLIVDNLCKAVKVGEKQMRPLICGEASSKTYY